MKNYFKILPVAAGLAFALLGTTSEATASVDSTTEEAAFGFCEGNEDRTCSITAQGSTTKGRWKEGPGSQTIN